MTIITKNSQVAAKVPLAADLVVGEVAVNTADGKMYTKHSDGLVKLLTPSKTDLSLGNVDNTSDANKPVSTATQTALNLKATIASPAFTGTATATALTVNGIVGISGVGYLDLTNSTNPSIVKPAALATVVSPVGGTNVSNPFWRGFQLASEAISLVGVNTFPRVSHYYTYSSVADPTDLTYNITAGNASTLNHSIAIITNGGTGSLILGTSGVEKARITSTGGVNIGTYSTDPGAGNLKTSGTINGSNLSGSNTGDTANVSITTPAALGVAAVGTGTTFARADHVHAGLATTSTALATARTIGMTGDVSWSSGSFDGTTNVTAASTLATITDSGTGTFKKVTTNTKGLVTGTVAVAQADITALLGTGSISNAMLANTAVANLSGTNTGDTANVSITTPAALGVAAVGTGTTFARADHVHLQPTLATLGAQAAGTYATGTGTASGTNTGDQVLPVASSTTPAALGVAAVGVGTTFARADHVHLVPTTVSGSSGSCTGNAASATQLSATQQTSPITGSQSSMTMTADSAARGSFICRATGTLDANLAGMSFWNDAYALKLGIRADGFFGLGGWSRGAWSWYSDNLGNMVAAGNVTAYSDPRLKDDIKLIKSPLDIINSLDGVTFTWNDRSKLIEAKWGKRDYGVLADQVKAVMPEIVTASVDDEDGVKYDTVDYSKIVPVLIEAIKEQQKQIDLLMSLQIKQ